MDRELRGRRIAVTGASSGIGQAVATALAGRGAAVVGFARRFAARSIERPPEPGAVLEIGLDVTDEAAVAGRFAELGPLDGLILSHGSGVFGPVGLAEASALRELLEAHVVGSFLCCREAIKSMRPARSGHIVVVSSLATRRAFADTAAYTAAKMGQLGLARVLTEELRPSGIRVTSLIGGAVDTPLWDARAGFDRDRMLAPEDVAALVIDVLARGDMAIDEVVFGPPDGAL
jgi:NAD(P)-dependent dehydrogenase (short-subunit alcohol dehydrogenase family)